MPPTAFELKRNMGSAADFSGNREHEVRDAVASDSIPIAMPINHSPCRGTGPASEVSRTHVALMSFLDTHPATRVKPWTDVEAEKYKRLLKRWHEAVQELSARC